MCEEHDMNYMQIKTPDGLLQFSKIVLGTDYFGTTVSEKDAFLLMDVFMDAGGNCIDTARVYTAWLLDGEGASESLIGRWLKQRGNREKVVISTKGGHPPVKRMNEGRLSRACIESDLEESLKVLNVNEIDLYWLHRDEVTRPVEEIMETMSRLVSSGKIRAIGCSNWKIERIREANAYAQTHGLVPFCASQIQWSLAFSTPEAHKDPTIVCMNGEDYTWYLENNLPVMAYSSQAQGFFSMAAAHGLNSINQKAFERFLTPENIARLERVKAYAAQNGLSHTAVVLGYILCNRLPAMAIIGCKTMEQLKDSLTAADIMMQADLADWLYEG